MEAKGEMRMDLLDDCKCPDGEDHTVECIEVALEKMVISGEVEVAIIDGVKKYRLTPNGQLTAEMIAARVAMDMN